MPPSDKTVLQAQDVVNRRTFLTRSASGLGVAALASLFGDASFAAPPPLRKAGASLTGGLPGFPNFAAKAKRIIYLHQSGAPSQFELFDYKPGLVKYKGQDLPASIRNGQRLTGMTSGQANFPVAPNVFQFAQHGKGGVWLSELLPHLATQADKLCVIRSMNTEAINHDPAITFFQTGSQLAGRPSIGSWMSYGLGTENRDLPAFVVLTSIGSGRSDDQPLYDRLWGSGFLPTQHQGVKFRNAGDPVLYLSNPPGVDTDTRREMMDEVKSLNQIKNADVHDPEISTRISQYELAFRMQASVPDLTNLKTEPKAILDLYGPDVTRPGSYAANCLLARRLCEKGTRFVQLFHMGWDHHGNLPNAIRGQCRDIDQPTAALLQDLEAARPLRRNARRVGRRVRAHGVFARDADGRRTTGATTTPVLLPMACGRGHQGRHHLRRNRRLFLQRCERPGGRSRFARHDFAPDGRGSHPLDLPLPGPRLPFDGRVRRSHQTDFGLIFVQRGIMIRTAAFVLLTLTVGSVVAFGTTAKSADAPASAKSKIAFVGANGKMQYAPYQSEGDTLPDFSVCGYQGGGIALPDAPVKATLAPQAGSSDDTVRIQAALDTVGALPLDAKTGLRGAVVLQAGTFRVGGPLFIRASGVVFRGSGPGENGTLVMATGNKAYSLVTVAGGTFKQASGESERKVTETYVPVGAKTVTVADENGLKVGDRVILRRNSNEAFIHALGMDSITPRASDPKSTVQWKPFTLFFDRTITQINGKYHHARRPADVRH